MEDLMANRLILSGVAAAALALPSAALAFKLQKPEFPEGGTFTFGGNLTFASVTDEPEEGDGVDSTTFAIAPRIGYFVIPNLEIGVGLGYQSTTSGEGDSEVESSGFNVGLYGAYYFRFLEGNALYPYVGVAFDYFSQTPGEDIETSGTDIRPGIGLALAIGSRTGGFMKLGIDYQIRSSTTEIEVAGDTVEAESSRSGVVVGLGFGLYIH
jgi:hypothetical protein